MVTSDGAMWAGDDSVGPNPLTPAEFRRFRATNRFSVGDGIRLRGLDPDSPVVGACVVIVDGDRRVVGIAVLTDSGARAQDRLFALWVPPAGAASTAVSAFVELQEQSWSLVDAGLTWNDVADRVGRSSGQDLEEFESACLIADPVTGHRRSMTAFDAPVPLHPPDAATRPTAPLDLSTALEILGSVKEAYAAYECDYQRVLAAPALADVTEDATAAFIEAFGLAVALEPEHPDQCPPMHAARFVSAVAAAERTWEVAEAQAIRLGIANFDPAQRTQIRRARQALDLALRADTPAGEREASLAAARRLLDGLVTFPAPLEAVIARAIPAGSIARAALEP